MKKVRTANLGSFRSFRSFAFATWDPGTFGSVRFRSIQTAPQRRFIFEDTELELIPTCAVNITMPSPESRAWATSAEVFRATCSLQDQVLRCCDPSTCLACIE